MNAMLSSIATKLEADETSRTPLIAVLAGIVLLALAYLLLYPVFVMNMLCFALFAAAFNLLFGFVGLMSFGHAAFFGGAAYITAYTAKQWGLTPEVAILLGTLFAAGFGVFVGFLAIRRQGIYFAMITLAIAQMFYFFCVQASFTGGEDGIQGVPRGALFGILPLSNPVIMYAFVCTVFLLASLAVWRIVNSPFGTILRAIRDNEPRAISLGYRVERYKLGVFVMSAALAGLAGGTRAIVFQLASLTDVGWQSSGHVVLMTLLGGVGTILGPTVGAVIVVSLENYLATSGLPVQVVLGLVFIFCVMLFRRGLVGEFNALARRVRKPTESD